MGKFDSSKTRVVPVFNDLYSGDPTGESWIHKLLSLPQHGKGKPPTGITYRILPGPAGTTWGWGENEKKLSPHISLLRWLVENLPSKFPPEKNGSIDDPQNNRKDLLKRNPATMRKALEALKDNSPSKAWYVLEGLSQPDVYLETDQAVIVIEGKRTELGPTTSTSYMPGRHQILRHIDCAWEIKEGRKIYGFFIVEGTASGEVPHEWVAYSRNTVSKNALNSSLPHRTKDEKIAIAESFLGVATWQRVCSSLNVDFNSLPNES